MNRETYQARKAAGLCVGSEVCKRPVRVRAGKKLTTCARCWENRLRAQRGYRQRRFEAGFCAYMGCKEKPDGFACAKHLPVFSRRQMEWAAKHRKRLNQDSRVRRKKRRDKGLCERCNQPLVARGLCERHHKEALAAGTARRRAAGIQPEKKKRCGVCGDIGHYAPGCTFKHSADLRLEEFATARPGSWTMPGGGL